MPKCLECNAELAQLDNLHLAVCCGLTLQEYAIRHGLSLDIVVPQSLLNVEPSVSDYPQRTAQISRKARIVLAAVRAVGVLKTHGALCEIPGEIRRLDQLLWLAQCLEGYGFRFRQTYVFNSRVHRVTATNHLKALAKNLGVEADAAGDFEIESLAGSEMLLFLTVAAALRSDLYGDYLFLHFTDRVLGAAVARRIKEDFDVEMKALAPVGGEGACLRTLSSADAQALFGILRPQLARIPCAYERFYEDAPQALVAKELVFDSAHFITDHPGKCANLHGGRYQLIVKVKDHIDPYTGFVVDYGYLKKVVQREVIEKLDHHHLNLSDASLGWRSSTELINLFIWKQLIEYLPNLYELQTYETAQSYCCFQGPELDDMREFSKLTGSHFASAALGRSTLRRYLSDERVSPHLTIVG